MPLRKSLPAIADHANIIWLSPHNMHVAGYIRQWEDQTVCCLFNLSYSEAILAWYALREKGIAEGSVLKDHWTGDVFSVGMDNSYFILPPYGFMILEMIA